MQVDPRDPNYIPPEPEEEITEEGDEVGDTRGGTSRARGTGRKTKETADKAKEAGEKIGKKGTEKAAEKGAEELADKGTAEVAKRAGEAALSETGIGAAAVEIIGDIWQAVPTTLKKWGCAFCCGCAALIPIALIALMIFAATWGWANQNEETPSGTENCVGTKAVEYARSQLGKPYVWGDPSRNWPSTTPPDRGGEPSYDCSGLVGWAWYWASAGNVSMGGQTDADWGDSSGKYDKFSWDQKSELKSGDLIYYDPGNIHHVVIYAGEEKFIHAPSSGDVVKEQALSDRGTPAGFLRPKYEDPNCKAGANLGKTVVIDPGHQAHGDNSQEPVCPGSSTTKPKVTGGATGNYTGQKESELNLDVGLRLKSYLEGKNVNVVMTRTSENVNLSNIERAEIANRNNAAVFIRIHADHVGNSGTRGTAILAPENGGCTKGIYSESARLSSLVQSRAVRATGFLDRGITQRGDLTGFNWSKVPSTLIEMGFLSNRTEDNALEKPAMRQKIAEALGNAIIEYLK